MTTYTANAGERAVHAKTLTAATVDIVNLGGWWDRVEIANVDGAAAIYVTVDGSTPTVGGANTYVLPAAIGTLVLKVRKPISSVAQVQLKSSGTPVYSVTGLDGSALS